MAPSTKLPDFAVDDSLAPWNMSMRAWITKNQKDKELDGLATANVVFNPEGKVLVIQRASSDSMPNRWELPGGGADEEDPTVLYAAARELWEESSLVAKRFTHIVTEGPNREPGTVFPNSTKTKTWCRFTFLVEVESCNEVKLDPHEHQDFTWASEEEIRAQTMGDRQLTITTESAAAAIIEAFRLRKTRLGTL